MADEGATPSQMMQLFKEVGGMEFAIPGASSGGVASTAWAFAAGLGMPKPANTDAHRFRREFQDASDWLAEDGPEPGRIARPSASAARCRGAGSIT